MKAFDEMKIEILADGTIKTTTDPISAPNHANADAFVKTMNQLAGGEVTVEKRHDSHGHTHAHVHHEHQHN